jgi:hypothetical protein
MTFLIGAWHHYVYNLRENFSSTDEYSVKIGVNYDINYAINHGAQPEIHA